jgi:hypothetical protein
MMVKEWQTLSLERLQHVSQATTCKDLLTKDRKLVLQGGRVGMTARVLFITKEVQSFLLVWRKRTVVLKGKLGIPRQNCVIKQCLCMDIHGKRKEQWVREYRGGVATAIIGQHTGA